MDQQARAVDTGPQCDIDPNLYSGQVEAVSKPFRGAKQAHVAVQVVQQLASSFVQG